MVNYIGDEKRTHFSLQFFKVHSSTSNVLFTVIFYMIRHMGSGLLNISQIHPFSAPTLPLQHVSSLDSNQ